MILTNLNDMETQKAYTLTELCNLLSISQATVKNWIKLKKIIPNTDAKGQITFSKQYVEKFINEIKSDSSPLLKSRRNKKYKNGNSVYNDYVSKDSLNLKAVQDLLNYLGENKIKLSENEIKYILADCAIQLFLNRNKTFSSINNNYLLEYLNSNNIIENYSPLVEVLIQNKQEAETFFKNNPELFNHKYIYEEDNDILGLLYLSLSDISDRKARGAYFTPNKTVKKIIDNLDFATCKNTNAKITDPCCGSGNFLIQLPKNIKVEQIFGNDIDKTSIDLTRINITLKYNCKNIQLLYKNFSNTNFLTSKTDTDYRYIIGNPPWGYEFSTEEINDLKQTYLCMNGKNTDSYDLFTEKALNSLSPNGVLFFVLPEAILNVKSHQIIRNIIVKDTSILYLEYLGNTFDKVQCPSIIIKFKKSKQQDSGMKVKTKNREFIIEKPRKVDPTYFNFNMTDQEYQILDKIINNKNNLYLKSNGIFSLGIVTGNNKKYLSKTKTPNNESIIKGKDIKKYQIRTIKNFIKFEPENFQQVAPIEIYRSREKLLYKFISKELSFAYDNKGTLTLNSCNILIPTFKDLEIKYVMTVLNSRIAQFIFNKRFNSVKVLRSHLEQIPIPQCDKKTQQEIIKKADEIISTKDTEKYEKLYNDIDYTVAKLYNLSDEEYKLLVS